MIDRLASAWGILRTFVPPDLSPHYLVALVGPVLESIAMTAGAMLIAYAASLPLGMVIGSRVPGTRALHAVLAGLRAVPDLTLAIFCVIAVGVGPAAGMLAMAIFYTAAVAKIFGDLFLTADKRAVEALRSTGASWTSIAFFGLLPLKIRDLLTYGSYEFESAVRASVIVGAVGGGGLGTELVGTLNGFDFRRTTTILLVLILIVALIDQATARLRRHPLWLLVFVPPAAYAVVLYWPHGSTLAHAGRTFMTMLPPRLPVAALGQLPRLVLDTILMAIIGTGFGIVLAFPLGLLSARNLSPAWLAALSRRLLEAMRAVPEVVWGLVLIALAGVGPVAGTVALGLHSAGCLGRLFAESFENVPTAPVLAVASTGASAVGVASFATVPLAIGPVAIHALFRLEWNLRQAAVVGMIGAGGIGQALFEAQQLFFYQQMIAYLLITWALVFAVDRASEWTRQKFGWTHLSAEEAIA